jgi:hypothetical protein
MLFFCLVCCQVHLCGCVAAKCICGFNLSIPRHVLPSLKGLLEWSHMLHAWGYSTNSTVVVAAHHQHIRLHRRIDV